MLQKSLGYAISKFYLQIRKILQSSRKIVFFKKIKNYKIWTMILSSNRFIKAFFESKIWLS